MSVSTLNRGDVFTFVFGVLIGALVYGIMTSIDGVFPLRHMYQEIEVFPLITASFQFLTINLGYSVIAFVTVLSLYGHFIVKLKRGLLNKQLTVVETKKLLIRMHTLSGVFFGIGVLWTAIGMRSALLSALGNLDENTAAQIGAFEILKRLVDGGILVALSTTIVGGFGGYLMKIVETFYVSAEVQAFLDKQEYEMQEQLLTQLSSANHVDTH